MSRKTRFIGTCQICEHRQKLEKRKGAHETLQLVHHGYRRPGDGSIHGDCFGVKYEPYETATDGCTDYFRYAQDRQQALTQHLKKLESGEFRTLSIMVFKGFRQQHEWRTVSADSEDPKERYDFERELESLIRRTRSDIGGWKHEEERMVARIAAWPPATKIASFEEEAEVVSAERRRRSEAVAKERAERRAARNSKARELEEKRFRWEAEKAELMRKYRELFVSLAAHEKTPPGMPTLYWTQMYKAKGKKAYLQFYPSDLGCDDALVKLRLAKQSGHGLQYATAYGAL